jgi:hypothetical protein
MTWRNQFFSRYRCRDCLSQFWVISQKTYIAGATLLAAILVAALAVFVVGIVFNPDDSVPTRRRSDAMPRPHPPVVVTALAPTFDTTPRPRS